MNIYLTEIASAAAIAQENMQREHVPGLAMAFIKNGELVMSQCLGIADTERGIPVSNETYLRPHRSQSRFSAGWCLNWRTKA